MAFAIFFLNFFSRRQKKTFFVDFVSVLRAVGFPTIRRFLMRLVFGLRQSSCFEGVQMRSFWEGTCQSRAFVL